MNSVALEASCPERAMSGVPSPGLRFSSPHGLTRPPWPRRRDRQRPRAEQSVSGARPLLQSGGTERDRRPALHILFFRAEADADDAPGARIGPPASNSGTDWPGVYARVR